MYDYENKAISKGYSFIVGCDEVGRGPLAGPLVAAAVILNPKKNIEGLNDSKQLSEKKRLLLFEEIKQHAIDYKIIFKTALEVDHLNVYQASKIAMTEAIDGLQQQADYILSDAMPLKMDIPCESLIKGDTLSASIAAASILAKVSRDQYMIELAKDYPNYGFERHKGYPTKHHIDALKRFGVMKEHRQSFKPVKMVIEQQMQLNLEE